MQLNNPIVEAVAPLKQKAMSRAEESAKRTVARVKEDLKQHNYDIRKAAPYPKRAKDIGDYLIQEAKYHLYQSLTTWTASAGFNDPLIVKVDAQKVLKYIAKCIGDAARQFDTFAVKLTEKIGKVEEAILEGYSPNEKEVDVWGYSYLHILRSDSSRETWKTQEIHKTSMYGKHFNQWPTRKLKYFQAHHIKFKKFDELFNQKGE
ncbi:hypothetical protein EKK58_07370 [Candidatus Dependentiae bacterium]|nr:MAG: hypothetical protein EKK58_07370 [Candidatus Dependentiae bacterium]